MLSIILAIDCRCGVYHEVSFLSLLVVLPFQGVQRLIEEEQLLQMLESDLHAVSVLFQS